MNVVPLPVMVVPDCEAVPVEYCKGVTESVVVGVTVPMPTFPSSILRPCTAFVGYTPAAVPSLVYHSMAFFVVAPPLCLVCIK